MKKFQSKKIVNAKEMTSDEWVEFRRTLTKPHSDASLDVGLEGYVVAYNMGTTSEYWSWSPKAEFEDGYVSVGG